ncbi:alpha/beta hydrolase [Mesorhizobium sp. M0663]|uniref:alpha/beta fold hydrolase n=1 Tax=unclassified Mesorhizobium TaxID=325217 RepID=UPI003335D017
MKLDDLVLAADVTGNPQHPALLLLHGWPHNRRVYDTVIDAFAADFYAIVPDLPGIGESIGAPRTGEKAVLADIVLTAAEELGAKDIVVAGFDVGGMIAFGSAREHGARIRGAVVAHTVLPGSEPWTKVISNPHIWHFAFHAIPELPEVLVTGHEREYFDFFTNFLAGRKEAVTEKHRAAFTKAYERPEALKAGFDWYRAFEADAKKNMRHKRIRTPMLYLRGNADGRGIEDYVAGIEAIGAEALTGKVISGAGEFMPLEKPEAFVQVVRDFAKSAVSARAKAA